MFGLKKEKNIDKIDIVADTKICFDCDLHFNPVDGYTFKYCPMCSKKLYGFDDESFERLEKLQKEKKAIELSIDDIKLYNKLTFEERVYLIKMLKNNLVVNIYFDLFPFPGVTLNEASLEMTVPLDEKDIELFSKMDFSFRKLNCFIEDQRK